MRNNVIKPAKQFIARYGEQAHSKAREAERAARKQGKGQLASFCAKVAERIVEGRATLPVGRNKRPRLSVGQSAG